MQGRIAIAALMVVVGLGLGCGTMGGGGQLENTVYDTHRRVVGLEKNLGGSVTKLNQTAAELSASVDASDQQVRTLQGLIEENQYRVAAVERKLDALTATLYRHFKLTQPGEFVSGAGEAPPSEVSAESAEPQIVQPRSPAPAIGPAPVPSALPPPAPATGLELEPVEAAPTPTPTGSPDADYQQAQRSFAQQAFATALEQFTAFLQRYPDSEHVPNAHFWRAKSLQGLGSYQEAVDAYENLRVQFSTSTKVPYALHQQAVCHSRLGQTARAIQLLDEVVRDYPMTPAADQAKTDLKKLRGN